MQYEGERYGYKRTVLGEPRDIQRTVSPISKNNKTKVAKWSRRWANNNADKRKAILERYESSEKGRLTIAKKQARQTSHRIQLKLECMCYLGSVCEKCGLKDECIDIYHFHHRDPLVKNFSISKYREAEFDEIRLELDKCDLLCGNCHRKQHFIYDPNNRFHRYKLKRKQYFVSLLGGACTDCGLVDHPCVYDFHHPNSKQKDFSFRDNKSKAETLREVAKCVLLCCNCHRKRHHGKPLQRFTESPVA